MRALAITSATRSPDLPDVPTMIESGLKQLTLDFWAGMLAPAGTPADIVNKLNAAINESLRSPEMKASMTKLGFEAKIGSPQDFAAFIAEELPRWAHIVKCIRRENRLSEKPITCSSGLAHVRIAVAQPRASSWHRPTRSSSSVAASED